MATVLLIVQLMIALTIVVLVLLQRSEGGALGIGGGGGGGGFMSGRGAGNALTRATGIAAALFFVVSLTLGIMATRSDANKSLLDDLAPAPTSTSPVSVPAPLGADTPAVSEPEVPMPDVPATDAAPAAPTTPAEPSVPHAE